MTAVRQVSGGFDGQQLIRLACVLDAGVPFDGPHRLIRVTEVKADGFDIGFKEVGDAHPLDILTGFTAPRHWAVLGLAWRGWAAPIDDSGTRFTRPSQHPARRRVRTLQLVCRTGHMVSVLNDGATADYLGSGEGRVADALCRALRLPSPSPAPDPAEWLAAMWLGELIGMATPGRSLSWNEMAGAHPVIGAGLGRVETPTTPTALVRAVMCATRRGMWGTLRREVVAGEGFGGIQPKVAAWMDDAMFANEVMAIYPPLMTMARTLEGLIGPESIGPVRTALAAWTR